MNDKAKNVATGLFLYKVNYNYVAKNGQLRGGTIVVEAKDIAEAQNIAPDRVASFGVNNFRIGSIKEY